MDIRELTALENEWLSRQPDTGFAEELDALYERTGMYDAWTMIFGQYVLLAREGNLEALKRALFLLWYGQAEPHWLCGIKVGDFDTGLVDEVLQMANALSEEGQLDAELRWMLPWYYLVAPWYLDMQDDLEGLKQVSGGKWDLYREGCIEAPLENRGQLGQYWKSIRDR